MSTAIRALCPSDEAYEHVARLRDRLAAAPTDVQDVAASMLRGADILPEVVICWICGGSSSEVVNEMVVRGLRLVLGNKMGIIGAASFPGVGGRGMTAPTIRFPANVGDLAVVVWHEDEPRVVWVAEATKVNRKGLVTEVRTPHGERMSTAGCKEIAVDHKEAIDVVACLRAAGRLKRPLRSVEDASALCRPFRREQAA